MNLANAADEPRLLQLPTYRDERGRLAWLESPVLPFDIRRVYFLDSAETGVVRAEHGHINLRQVLIALGGELAVDVTSSSGHTGSYRLLPFGEALYVPAGRWRSVEFCSEDAICLVLASEKYDEYDYIRDQDEFWKWSECK